MSGIVEAYIAYAIMLGLVVWFSRDLFSSISGFEAELELVSGKQSLTGEEE